MPDDLAAHARKQGLLPEIRVRPGTAIGPVEPSAADLPDWYSLLGGALHEGMRGFLQGIPQGITAARNELTAQPGRGGLGAPPRTTPQVNPMGGLPLGNLGALDWSRAAEAFGRGYQAEEPPVPHAIRNLLGQGTSQAIADYALDFMSPETGAVLGPAYQATVGAGLGKLGQASKTVLTPVLRTALGQLISQKGLHPLGVGPTSAMMREVTKPYEQQVAVRLQEGGQIAREMRKRMQRLRLDDPALDARLQQLAKGDPGPLQRLVQKYVTLNIQHGPQALSTSIDNQAIELRAAAEGIPYPLVREYGNQLLGHMQKTLQDLQATGATPFVKARGKQFQKGLPPGPWYNQAYFAATPKGAKPVAEDVLRRKFASAYLAQLFASEKPQALGQVGAQAFTGSGVREVYRAGLRGVVNRLTDPADPVSRFTSDVYRPGYVQVKSLREFGKPLAGKYLPETLYNYLTHEIGQVGLVGPATQKVYTKFGRQAGPIVPEGKRNWGLLGTALEKYAGLQKKLWIGNFSTAGSNILSNQAAVELAARREGFPVAAFTAELPDAAKEVLQYKQTGRPSPDVAGLRRFSRAFVETQAATAALAGKKRPEELAGLTGRIFTLPGGKRVLAPTGGEAASRAGSALVALHDYPEKVYKLALYKTLQPKVGAQRAGELVEKYLFDYSDRGALLEMLDQHGLWVFNAFPTKAMGLLLDTLVNRPDLVARYPRLQAQLMQEAGAKERYGKLAEFQKGPFTLPGPGGGFLDVSRQHVFGDTLRTAQETLDAARERRLPDYLKPDELGNLAGHLAFSPVISALENRRLYGSTAHPVRISPIGAPMEQQMKSRGQEMLYQMAPGFVRGIAEYRAAKAGIPTKGGRLTEPRQPGDVLLQSFFGIRPVSGETSLEKRQRLADDPTLGRQMDASSDYLGRALDYIDAHPNLNRYRKSLSRVQNPTEIDVQFWDARKYLQSLLAGPLTDDKKRQINEAAARFTALLERKEQLNR